MTAAKKARAKVRPIKPDEMLEEKGLPCNLDAERCVLASILLNGRFADAATLQPDDFSIERHQRIFTAMAVLQASEEHISRVTVAEELQRRNQLAEVGIGYMADIDAGMPALPCIESFVRIVREKAVLRRVIFAARKVMNEALLETARSPEILASHLAIVQELSQRTARQGVTVDSLTSIFADATPIEYAIEPELPADAIVYLSGDSESGKSTVACAWARDLIEKGHAVLLLDRDKNPRKIVRDRFERLGMGDHPRLRIWDTMQSEEAPQPDDPAVVDWVMRMKKETGRAPMVIVDSLIGFLRDGENENDSVCMRALFDRCRVLTKLGALLVLIHHVGKNGEARGSSDFRPAGDQGFLVTNYNPDGSRLLSKITLKVTKSRYGLTTDLLYNYAGGRFLRDESHHAAADTATSQLANLLRTNPGVTTKAFYLLAGKQGISEPRANAWLSQGVLAGMIRRHDGSRNRKQYFLTGDDPQPDLESSRENA